MEKGVDRLGRGMLLLEPGLVLCWRMSGLVEMRLGMLRGLVAGLLCRPVRGKVSSAGRLGVSPPPPLVVVVAY